jgi:ABC-type bacteriocin/lantibiotic exporter with double-glycine peptidase domain
MKRDAIVAFFHEKKINSGDIRSDRSTGCNLDIGKDDGSIIDRLANVGLVAKLTTATDDDLDAIAVPAVIGIQDDRWAIVVGVRKDTIDVVIDGVRGWMSRDRFWAISNGNHLTVSEPFAWGDDIVGEVKVAAKRFSGFVWPSSILPVIATTLGVIIAAVSGKMVDTIGTASGWMFLWLVAMASLTFANVSIGALSRRVQGRFDARLRLDLSNDIMTRLLSMPFGASSVKTSGEIGFAVSSANSYAGVIGNMMTSNWMHIVNMVAGLTTVAIISPTWAFVLAAYVAAVWSFNIIIINAKLNALDKKNKETLTLSAMTAESVSGIATIKVQGIEQLVADRWSRVYEREVMADRKLSIIDMRGAFVNRIATNWFGIAILSACAAFVMNGKMGIGSMLAIVQVTGLFASSAQAIVVDLRSSLAMIRIDRKRFDDIAKTEIKTGSQAGKNVSGIVGRIEMKGVWFRYTEDSAWVIRGLNMVISPGEKKWLKSPSGSGKTTMIRLMSGLYEPEMGTVTIDGERPGNVRGAVIYLPQFVKLTGGSIMDNLIAMSKCNDKRKIKMIAEETGLWGSFVSGLPMGYETIVLYGGATLSGGQRQLIAITAALASECRVMLLDEAMANIDWSTRARIAQSPLFDGRTVVYASHDRFF